MARSRPQARSIRAKLTRCREVSQQFDARAGPLRQLRKLSGGQPIAGQKRARTFLARPFAGPVFVRWVRTPARMMRRAVLYIARQRSAALAIVVHAATQHHMARQQSGRHHRDYLS